jgi:uncharacterized protein with PIN domain
MLGPLSRYLRFMGYDTVSANSMVQGNSREDTLLLNRAILEERILLTRDRELARRGADCAILIREEKVIGQLQQLVDICLIEPELRMTRCSICNEPLRPAHEKEIKSVSYAPENPVGIPFFWCRRCRRLYWMGSHGRDLESRCKKGLKLTRISGGRLR